MSVLLASSLGVGIACGIFAWVASLLQVSVWMSFSGCTSYFVAGGGRNGFIKALLANYTGIAWAMFLLFFIEQVKNTNFLSPLTIGIFGFFLTGFISFAMTFQSKIKFLSFVPCAFIGCFSTFGSNGDWQQMIICVTLGNILGLACDGIGRFLMKNFIKEEKDKNQEPVEIEKTNN